MTMENRRKLALLNLCRSFLNVHGFITPAENRRIHNRIMKWQDKNRVFISDAQLESVNFVYDDNAKDEEEL